MNAPSSFCCRPVSYAAVAVWLTLIAFALADAPTDTKQEEDKGRSAKQAAKMLDALANHNKPPRIVKRPDRWPELVPLYPAAYDWKEEERVRKAITQVYQDTSEQLWEAMLERLQDRRYCVVLWNENCEDAEMISVGSICQDLAYSRLCEVFEQHLPQAGDRAARISLNIGVQDLAAWRRDRLGKALYQLQLEVCTMALRELAKVESLSGEEKAAIGKKIEAEMKELRRTKRPFAYKRYLHRTYSRVIARRIREASEKGTLNELQIDLAK